jgi:Tol biopolymer transport system component
MFRIALTAALATAALALAADLAGQATASSPPAMVGRDVISTRDYEGSATLAPDGATLYFAKRPSVAYLWVICVSRLANGRWAPPDVASFSGRASDTDPFVAPSGDRLFFVSNRAAAGSAAGSATASTTKADYDIWVVERSGDGWGEPRRLPSPINSERDELHPTVDRDGNLYFASNRPGAAAVDIYRAALVNGHYDDPVRLESAVNSPGLDTQPAISPDGTVLVFASSGRPDQTLLPGMPYARPDLYATTRTAAGWTPARPLAQANVPDAADVSPAFTADGTRLLFVSERGQPTPPRERPPSYRQFMDWLRSVENGLGNIYELRVDATSLDR